jgi:hypothetical protein
MVIAHRITGVLIVIFGIYVISSWLTGSHSEPVPPIDDYEILGVGLASVILGLFLTIRKQPIF